MMKNGLIKKYDTFFNWKRNFASKCNARNFNPEFFVKPQTAFNLRLSCLTGQCKGIGLKKDII